MTTLSANGILFIVSGPSGSGKKTFAEHIIRKFAEIQRVATYTTREPRRGEIEDFDYVFIGEEEFEELVASKEIFEFTRTYGDNLYGSPKRLIEAGSDDLIVELDYKGMLRTRAMSARRTVSIFVLPPDLEVMTQRIERRQREDNLAARRKKFFEQIQFAWAYDYVVQNGELDRFLAQAEAIAEAELLRRAGAKLLLDQREAFDDTLGWPVPE